MDRDWLAFVARVGLPAMAARRYFDDGHSEQLRLALILLDGTSEALLRRFVANCEMWFQLGDRAHKLNRELEEAGESFRTPVDVLTFPADAAMPEKQERPVFLSNTQRRKLWREFDPNADVATYFGHLSKDEARALKILHTYRNGAYHRNEHNVSIADVLVRLHMRLVSTLLRSSKRGIIRVYPPEDDQATREALGLDTRYAVDLAGIASALDEGRVDDDQAMADALARELRHRIGLITQRMETIRTDLGGWLPSALILQVVQLEMPWPEDVEVIRSADLPVNEDTLRQWTESLDTFGQSVSIFRHLSTFADIDKPLGELEKQVSLVEQQLDQEIQAIIDERLGK